MQAGRWGGGVSVGSPFLILPFLSCSSASGDPFQELVDLSLYTLLRAFLRTLESLHQGPKEQGDLRRTRQQTLGQLLSSLPWTALASRGAVKLNHQNWKQCLL